MKKYIEQRVDDLELEIKILKARDKLSTKDIMFSNSSLPQAPDYMYHSSVNLMYEPTLATAYSSYFDSMDKVDLNIKNDPLVSITQPKHLDTESFHVPIDKSFLPDSWDTDFPPYPDTIDSWDPNPGDVVDEYGFKMNHETITSWGVISEFDKMDKDFLEWLKMDGKRIFEESKIEKNKS